MGIDNDKDREEAIDFLEGCAYDREELVQMGDEELDQRCFDECHSIVDFL